MYTNILTEKQKSVLELLDTIPLIQDFYLAGGTALALFYGHRESIDFDFFKEESFVVDEVIDTIIQKNNVKIKFKKPDTLLLSINEISCSFFKYPYPLLKGTLKFKNCFNLASIEDIAAMKISAISTRGTKRDFIDLYFICNKDFSLQEIIKFYQKKFTVLNHELYHIYRSLIYFDDAESDPMPNMFEKVEWKEVKEFFQKETKKLFNETK